MINTKQIETNNLVAVSHKTPNYSLTFLESRLGNYQTTLLIPE